MRAEVQKGREAEEQTSTDRQHQREEQHATVQRYRCRPWNASRIRRDERMHSPIGEREAGGGSADRQHQALGDELTHQARPARA